MITDYMELDEIRTLLGVDEFELTDRQLQQNIFSDELDITLAEYSAVFAPDTVERTLAGHYTYLLGIEETATADQISLMNNIRLFAVYSVAEVAVISLSMFAPKTKTDGKSSATRFSPESVYRDVRKQIASRKSSLLWTILEALGIEISSGTNSPYLEVVVPSYDPVTNVTS